MRRALLHQYAHIQREEEEEEEGKEAASGLRYRSSKTDPVPRRLGAVRARALWSSFQRSKLARGRLVWMAQMIDIRFKRSLNAYSMGYQISFGNQTKRGWPPSSSLHTITLCSCQSFLSCLSPTFCYSSRSCPLWLSCFIRWSACDSWGFNCAL